MSQVPDEYYPKKVFRFPCLAFFINEICNGNIHEYLQILKAILYCKAKLDQNRFLALERSKKKKDGIVVCAQHLEQFLVAETIYLCI